MPNYTKEKLLFTENIEDLLMSGFLYDRKMWVDFGESIDISYFNNPNNAILFKIFKKFFDKFGSFPTPDITHDIINRKYSDSDDDGSLTAQIDKIYARDSFEEKELQYLHHETGAFIKNNKIKDSVLKSVELLEEGKIELIEEEIKQAVNWNADVDFGIRIDQVEERFDRLESLITGVIPSPWRGLNQMIGGGFFKKELTLFVGSSSVGKSIALDNIALHAWQSGYNVVLITLELSEIRKAQRIDAAATGINASEIIRHKDEVIQFYRNHQRDNKLFIKEYPYGSICARDIKQYLYQLDIYGHCRKPDLLVIDYLDIMNPNTTTHNTYEDQGTTGGNIRALGQEGDYPVVSCTQFSKNNLNVSIEELTEFYIADSFKKVMVSDCLIGMAAKPEERAAGMINFKTLKSRNGAKDIIIPLTIDYPKLLIKDLAQRKTS